MAARHDRRGGAAAGDLAHALVRVRDLAGRPRGTGFLADAYGTLVTSHEAVDGLARLVLHAPGGQVCLVEAAAVTALPASGLALVATEGLSVPPLPIAPAGPVDLGQRVRVHLPRAADGVVTGCRPVTYTATDRFHLLDAAYAIGLDSAGGGPDGGRGRDPDPVPAAPHASGTPVTDATTGAVLGVVATALQAGQRAGAFAIPLHPAAGRAPAPLAEVLARNAAAVPAYGPHLNLAGALRLTSALSAPAGGPPGGPAGALGPGGEPVPRPALARALDAFTVLPGGAAAPLVLGLVGAPGTGRSTELAALAARRAGAADPAPTVRLRGADLRPGDSSVADAVERALDEATRGLSGPDVLDPPYSSPAALAGVAGAAGRPLLVLLDSPEEMPPVLAYALPDWTVGTAAWLRATGTRLILACRPEFWDQAGALLPPDLLHTPPSPRTPPAAARPRTRLRHVPAPRDGGAAHAGAGRLDDVPGRRGRGTDADAGHARERSEERAGAIPPLPGAVEGMAPCLWVGDLTGREAERARGRYGLPVAAVAGPDAGHPLTLRMLAEVVAAMPGPPARSVGRGEVFSAYLDLLCLRIAERLAASLDPPPRGTALRRLAARVAGQVHEAARRCLGPGQGEVDRDVFDELFPWRTGWASAVLSEGLLVPAGSGYRFADEAFADWLQALHLDLDAALHALVHRWFAAPGAPVEVPVRLPSRPAARAGGPPHVPPAPAVEPPACPRTLPVPRHRAGPVVQALLRAAPAERAARLLRLVEVLDRRGTPPTRCARVPPPALLRPPPDADADTVPTSRPRRAARAVLAPLGPAARQEDAAWWAGRLLREVLLRLPDTSSCQEVLRELAGRIVVRSVESGGFDPAVLGMLGDFGPRFWLDLPCDTPTRLGLLRVLLPADPPPMPTPSPEREPGLGPGRDPRCEAPPGPPYPDREAVPDRSTASGGAEPWRTGPDGAALAGPDGLDPYLAGSGGAVPDPAGPDGFDAYRARRGGSDRAGPNGRDPWRTGSGGAGTDCADPGGAAPDRADPDGFDAYRARRGGSDRAGLDGLAPWRTGSGGAGADPASPAPGSVPVGAPGGPEGVATGAAADAAASGPAGDGRRSRARFLDAVDEVLRREPAVARAAVRGWLDDDRPLQTGPGGPPLTVACAAQALLFTHRRPDPDELVEALAAVPGAAAGELLAALAEEEPAAVCRAVHRWAGDPRPERRRLAAEHGPTAAAHARTGLDRDLAARAARALLAVPGHGRERGAGLAMLVRDPRTWVRHLPAALRHFAAGRPGLPAGFLLPPLNDRPEPVLAAFRARLRTADEKAARELLAELAAVVSPPRARRVAALVREHLADRPEHAGAVARHLDLRLEQGPRARSVLLPLVAALWREHPAAVRRVLAPVFAAPGTGRSRPLRQELLDAVLARERDPEVLHAVLAEAARGADRRHPLLTRDLVHRLALMLGRTPDGATRFDCDLVELAAAAPDFARLVHCWLADGDIWDALVGPSARRRLDALATVA